MVICQRPFLSDLRPLTSDLVLAKFSTFVSMEVNDALIDKLADLARLEFEPAEKEKLRHDLEKMISFVQKLQELDTSEEEPLLQMSTQTDVLREDEISDVLPLQDAIRNAPITDGKFFKVPKVINKE